MKLAGHTKLASYGADSTIDNFGYNFVADDYLILPDDEQPTVTVSDNPQVDLLEGFGVSTDGNMSVELNAEGNLTRGEAAFLTAGLINADRAAGTSRFADAAASIYSGSVAALEQMGAVSGLGPDNFGVDLEIRFQDLLSMMINAMGYQQLALARGGYPGGYLYIADFVGMMKGNTMAGTDVVSRQNAINLFARALESDNLEITGISGDSLQVVKNGTVAEAVHKAHKADGVVMEVGNYSMTADFITDPGTINIDGKILYTNGNDYSMFIGMKVTYYYNDEAEILFMFDNKQNNIMTLDAAKVYDASLEEVLFEEDGRDKKVRVKNPIVLFNGNRKYNATGETLMPQAGELTFIEQR